MSDTRDLHRVSTKALLYTPDKTKILVMHMFPGTNHEMYALPGGHIDAGEVPDDTIIREIQEELGISISGLKHVDFFVHINGKIVLAYKGMLAADTEFAPTIPKKEVGVWMSRSEFEAIEIEPSYKRLALEHWND